MVAQNPKSSDRSSHLHEMLANLPMECSFPIRSCNEDSRHPIHTVIAELADPSPCTQRIALGKLQCALTSSVLTTCDPEKDVKPLLRCLLEWFNLPAPSHEILILSMLSRLAQDTENRKLLIDLGADEFMRQYQADCCQTILPYVSSLLRFLSEPIANPVEENVRSISLHDTGLGFVVPTTQHHFRASGAGSVCERSAENVQIKEQESKMTCESYVRGCQPLGEPCPVIFDILDRNDQCKERGRGAYTDGYRASPSCREICWHPSSVTQAIVSLASGSFSEHAGNHCNQACPSHEGQEKAGPPRLNSPLKPPESHMFADGSDTGGLEPLLPCVRLEESDDKYLFNLNVTLQYLDDRVVLQAALKELREAVVFDFHPEAILQKYSIMQNTFVLLQKITDDNLEQMVFDFLLELVRQIKAALKISKETGFQVYLDSEPPLQGARAVGGADHEKHKYLERSYPTYLRQTTDNTFDSGNLQRIISLRMTLHQMALDLISLLTNERHRNMSFTILYDLLPLLKPPKSNLLDDKVQVQFAQYFHALCEVLQACNTLSQDLDILCKDVTSKRNFEKRAQRCSHLLRVLTFSAELLYLLQPCHVTGLLPSALVKPLITLAGDLVLSECAFGLQRNIFPYLKYLDPEFFKSYTCATEASFTLHVLVKELASSEEAVAQWKSKQPDVLSKINAEVLLKCMIQAVPNYAYFNHSYLVPRIINILPDILRLELVKTCQSKDVSLSEDHRCDVRSEFSKCQSVDSAINQARRLIWLLLSHASASVRQAAYDSLLKVSSLERRQSQLQDQSKPKVHEELDGKCKFGNVNIYFDSDEPCYLLYDSSGPLRPLSVLHRLLIFGTSIMGEIITVGLHGTATCKQSALLLQDVIDQLSETEVARIIPCYPWIACSAYLSPDLASMIQHLRSLLFQAKPSSRREFQLGNKSTFRPEWAQLSCVLRSLFSSSTSDRCRASTEVLGILKQCCLSEDSFCWWLEELKRSEISSLQKSPDFVSEAHLQFLRDPFHQCLKFNEATLFSLASASTAQDSTKKERFGFPPNAVKKVEDFLGIFKSTSAAEPIRKAAVEHLTWFIQDQSLRALLKNDEDLFKILIGEVLDWIKKGDKRMEDPADMQFSRSHTWSSKRMDSSDTGSTGLGISCLNLLARLAPASALEGVPPDLPEMLISNSCEVLWLLVPLIFHPLECVRNDMALLLAFTLFSSDRLLRDVNEIILDHDPEYCRLPSKGDTLSATLHSAQKDWIQIAVPGPFIGAYVFPCKVVVVPVRPSTQSTGENLLDEQLIHRIIAQSVLLQGGYENLLSSLESRAISAGEPLRIIELQTLACLSVLHADITIKNLLKLLADPRLCCGLEIQFLEELEAQCFRHPQAAKMLARASWVGSFERFLTNFPSTPEETAQLLKVIKLVQVIVNSKSAGCSGLRFLITVSKQILLPILAKSPDLRHGANFHHAIVLIEGFSAIDTDFTILKLFVDILLSSKEHKDATLFGQLAVALAKGTSLLSVLSTKFIKGPSAPYICCVLTVQCISLVAKGVASVLGSNSSQRPQALKTEHLRSIYKDSSSEASVERGNVDIQNFHGENEISQEEFGVQEDQGACLWNAIGSELVEVVLPLIKHLAHLDSHHYLSLRHKRLVREIVSCLWSTTSCVPPHLWEDSWSSTGTTNWLSRLLYDHEATIRGMGFGILAILASPNTWKTRSLLEQNWPELGDVTVRTALDTRECYAVREEALRFLISSTVWIRPRRASSNVEKKSMPAGFERIDSLGVNAALQRYKFWMLFPTMLQERDGTPGFCRTALELTLKLTISDLDFIKSKISLNPHVFQALVKHLEFGTARAKGDTSKCLHSLDIYAAKAYLGEILYILAQEEDPQIQSLLKNESLIAKLLCALSFCFQNFDNFSFDRKRDHITAECCSAKTLYSPVEHERFYAIIHVAEALNLLIPDSVTAVSQEPNPASNHIRVDDVVSFNLREGSPHSRPARYALGVMVGRSGVCRAISHVLSSASLMMDVRSAGKNESGRSQLVKRMQLAVCALVATLLSEEHLAKAILENDGLSLAENPKATPHLAPLLYNGFVHVMEDVHEVGRQPETSHDGQFLSFLHKMLFNAGGALQNLISFSSEAKQFAAQSEIPSRLLGHAYEAYSLLGSCYAAPMRNGAISPVTSYTNRKSFKHCNKAPKMVNHAIRPPVWSQKAKQGKLSEHHRSLLLGELIIYFRLLKSLTFENPEEAERSACEGIFDFIRLVWAFSLSEEDLLHEILGLLCNLAAQSDAAQEAIACLPQICQGASGKCGTLMDYTATIVLKLPSDQLSYTLAIGLLQILVTMAKARAVFLRKQYIAEFLQLFGRSVLNNDVLRQHLILQLLINVSIFPNGQRMLSRGLSDGSMLDLVLDTVEQTHYVPASSSALFLLRNLAFCRETRFFFLCNERTLPLLVKSLSSSSLEARANAASALWILTSTERRISSMLKKIDAWPSLVDAHEASKVHLKIFQTHAQKDGLDDTAGRGAGRGAAAQISKMGKLVRHVEQSLFAVTQLIGGMHEYD